MTKLVKEVAKELKIESDELLAKLKDLGVEAKDESFALDADTVDLNRSVQMKRYENRCNGSRWHSYRSDQIFT